MTKNNRIPLYAPVHTRDRNTVLDRGGLPRALLRDLDHDVVTHSFHSIDGLVGQSPSVTAIVAYSCAGRYRTRG